jgi:hypothetical protein
LLSELSDQQKSLLLKIKRGTFGKHAFRRWIFEEIKVQWVELWKDLMKFQLIEEKDVIVAEPTDLTRFQRHLSSTRH